MDVFASPNTHPSLRILARTKGIMSELNKRAITALTLSILSITTILFLESVWFAVVVTILVLLIGWEWCCLGTTKALHLRDYTYLFAICATTVATSVVPHLKQAIVLIGLLWWFGLAILVGYSIFRSQIPAWKPNRIHGVFVILPAATALMVLHDHMPDGKWYIIFGLLIVWTVDIGSYLSGKLIGSRPLARSISPRKTIEGAIGGLIGALSVGAVLYEATSVNLLTSRIQWLTLVVLTAIFCIVGDLVESIYKRNMGTKDSGRILPGHGGVLDRVDSTLAALPIFVAGMFYITGYLRADIIQ